MGLRPEVERTTADIGRRIVLIGGRRVLIDADLAALYGVTTKRLNEQVRRNLRRFPPDFVFRLSDQELARLRSQNATSNQNSEALALRHDALTADTRRQFREVIEALRRLMVGPEPPRRPIGFVTSR